MSSTGDSKHESSSGSGDSKPAGTGSAGGSTTSTGATAASTSTATQQRSRTACINCRATKQKCDGPSRIPCRRCELYNLECGYNETPSKATTAVKRKATDDPVAQTPTKLAATASTSYSGPQVSSRTSVPLDGDVASTILQHLEDLSQRLRGVEEVVRYGRLPPPMKASLPSLDELALPDTTAHASHMRMGNPVSAIAESFPPLLDEGYGNYPGYSANVLPSLGNGLGNGNGNGITNQYLTPGLLSPDAVSRGIITVEQAQRYFQFFVDHCRYWVHGFVPEQFRDCMRVRQTSPLLFGAVCCVSSYYLDSSNGEQGLQLYLSLVALLNEVLAPIIMSPHNPELDDDFVLGIALSIIWKAPRLRSRNMNQASFPNMQKLAKLNNSTTYFLAGIATRAARVNELNQTPALLMAGDTSPETIARCRLWLWMCFVDAHGCMQNGRAASIDLTDSLKVTRMFASLNSHPTDVELCALLEVSAVYRTFHASTESDKPDLQALGQANTDLDQVTSFWYKTYPRLHYEGAFVTQFIAPFHRLVINGDVYRSWAARNKDHSDNNGLTDDAPVLSHEEAKYLSIAVESASTILLFLTTAARAEGGRRVPRFEEPQYWKDGLAVYKPMEPDVEHARHVRTAVDTVVCVIIVFAAMFLAKLKAANLMRCDLSVVTPANPIRSYEIDSKGRIALYSKFFRIIELASDFLEMVAPNAGHPCIAQSRVLRSLLATASTSLMDANNGPMAGMGMSVQHSNLLQQQQQHLGNNVQQLSSSGSGNAGGPGGGGGVTNLGNGSGGSSSSSGLMQSSGGGGPRYQHSLLGQATLDHSPNSPAAGPDYHDALQMQQQQQHGPISDYGDMTSSSGGGGVGPGGATNNLNDMLGGIGQPGNPLVSSFMGGDEWTMLMTSLGLQPPSQ